MIPNSGIYTIKIKIDQIANSTLFKCNVIGITCNTDKTNNSQNKDKYWYYSTDYIGWSSFKSSDDDQDEFQENARTKWIVMWLQ